MPYNFNFGLPPTPQSHTPRADDYKNVQANNEHFDPAFAAFQQNFQYDPSQFIAQPQIHHLGAGSPPLQQNRHSVVSLPEPPIEPPPELELSPRDVNAIPRSSSEEKDILTPQQNKRKAQNRAAQRAFRERKEKHVKDLEARNTTLQHESITLQNEVDRLRRELARTTAENEILRATSGSSSNGPTPFLLESDRDDLDSVSVSHGYIPTDYSSKLKQSRDKTTEWSPSSKWAQFGTLTQTPVDEENGEPLYTAGQTWDYIQSSVLFKKGLVDVGDVCERLKKVARCDGQGPVFCEGDIRRAISESAVAGGRDELI